MVAHLRLENHWLACMASAGGGARIVRTTGGLAVLNPDVPGHAFNFIALRGLQPDRLAPALEQGEALLAGEGRPPALFLSPAAGDMEALAAELPRLGWQRRLRQVVLVRELPADLPVAVQSTSVQQIATPEIPTWCQTLVEAYGVDPITAGHLSAAWGGMLAATSPDWTARAYLARVNGQPAGTGLTWIQGDLAGLYCGAVLPSQRRQGLHRALMVARLIDAAAAGCHLACLQTEAGSPVEQLCVGALGFARAYYRELWAPLAPPDLSGV